MREPTHRQTRVLTTDPFRWMTRLDRALKQTASETSRLKSRSCTARRLEARLHAQYRPLLRVLRRLRHASQPTSARHSVTTTGGAEINVVLSVPDITKIISFITESSLAVMGEVPKLSI